MPRPCSRPSFWRPTPLINLRSSALSSRADAKPDGRWPGSSASFGTGASAPAGFAADGSATAADGGIGNDGIDFCAATGAVSAAILLGTRLAQTQPIQYAATNSKADSTHVAAMPFSHWNHVRAAPPAQSRARTVQAPLHRRGFPPSLLIQPMASPSPKAASRNQTNWLAR